MNIENMLKTTYNGIADKYVKESEDDWKDKKYIDMFLKYLDKNMNILDIGCGVGELTEYISNKGHNVLGIDNAENMLEIARKRNPKAEFKNISLYDLCNLDRKFDAIIATYILVHISKTDISSIIKEFYNKLNKNGYAFFVFTTTLVEGIHEEALDNNYNIYIQNYSIEEVDKILNSNGFKVIETHNDCINNFNIGIIIAQKI